MMLGFYNAAGFKITGIYIRRKFNLTDTGDSLRQQRLIITLLVGRPEPHYQRRWDRSWTKGIFDLTRRIGVPLVLQLVDKAGYAIFAINILIEQAKLAMSTGVLPPCTNYYKRTHGLSCAHTIRDYHQRSEFLPVELISDQWRHYTVPTYVAPIYIAAEVIVLDPLLVKVLCQLT